MKAFMVCAVLALAGCANGERSVEIHASARVGVFESGSVVGGGRDVRATLQADSAHTLTLKADGYEPREVTFTPRVSGERVVVFALEALLFPPALLVLPWWISMGAFDDFDPDAVTVEMKPVTR